MKRALLALAVACHTNAQNPSPAPPPPSQTPSPLPTPAPSQAPPTAASAAPEGPKRVDDVDAWFRTRGALPPRALVDGGGDCTSATLQGHDALLCRGAPSESLPTGESVYPLSIFYVANHKTELALVTPIAAGPLDREIIPGESPPDDMYIELEAALDPVGTTLTISEKPGKTCNKVLAEYKSSEDAGHRRVVQKACAARGKYVLQNGKLVRTN